ncbi:MAG: GGDEF domain-containing protein [Candidatus Omnitrophota bacterium]
MRIGLTGPKLRIGISATLGVSLLVFSYILYLARASSEQYLAAILFQSLMILSVWFGLASGLLFSLFAVLGLGGYYFFWTYSFQGAGDIGFEESVWFFLIPLGALVGGYLGDAVLFIVRLFARFERQIESLVTTHQLGMIGDEKYFEQALGEECARARRSLSTFCVIAMEIANLEEIERLIGADASKIATDKMAEAVCRSTRDIDKKARLAGSRVGLMLVDCSREFSEIVIRRIVTALSNTELEYRDRAVKAALRLAHVVVSFPEDGDTPSNLIRAATDKLSALPRTAPAPNRN